MKQALFWAFALQLVAAPVATRAASHLTPRPPIYGIPAKTLPRGHWVVRGYWIVPRTNRWFSPTQARMVSLPPGWSFSSASLVGKIRYGVTSRLTAVVNVPYVRKRLSTPYAAKDGAGLGDVIVAALYKLHHNKHRRFLLSALLFSKWPTGRSGNLRPEKLPLGTGSVDLGFALMPEKEIGRWDMRWAGFYIARGKNKDGVDLGDVVNLSWSLAYNVSRRLIAEGTLLYKRSAENREGGRLLRNTDTRLVQAILGAQVRLKRTVLAQLAVPATLSEKRPFGSDVEIWVGLYALL